MSRPTTRPHDARQPDVNRYLNLASGAGASAQKHWRWFAGIGVSVVLMLYGYEFVAGDQGLLAMRRLKAETEAIRAHTAALHREMDTLTRQAAITDPKLYEQNPSLLEKTVRDSRHLAHPGEIIYTFDEAGTATTPAGVPEVTIATRPPKKDKNKPTRD